MPRTKKWSTLRTKMRERDAEWDTKVAARREELASTTRSLRRHSHKSANNWKNAGGVGRCFGCGAAPGFAGWKRSDVPCLYA